jgi:sialate O-acetylesterase
MLKTLSVPDTGMAVTVDYTGDSKNIHPANKEVVGHRLGLWALARVYGRDIPYSGPVWVSQEKKGDTLACLFRHCDGGLKSRDGELKGFMIAGEDRQWHPAAARIEGETVLVSSAEVRHPVAVRYAWAPNPCCNLVNGAGLPASPFRTDDWPTGPQDNAPRP